MKKTSRDILVINSIGEMLFLYGLLGWIYGVVIQFYHPSWVAISHLFPWFRLDNFAILSFFISALGFFIWRLSAKLIVSTHDYKNN
jgi:hypothetical protein